MMVKTDIYLRKNSDPNSQLFTHQPSSGIPNHLVYIYHFRIVTRHMSAEDWIEESYALDIMIGTLGFKVESDVVYTNGYSGPGSAHPKSEMWKIKKSVKNVKEDLETVPYTVVATHHVGQDSVSFDSKKEEST